MTIKFDNVFINNTASICGPNEHKGPLSKYFDKYIDNYYFDCKTWENAESKLLDESINILLNKANINRDKIDSIIAGDLLNQITSSCFGSYKYNLPFIGIYSACATYPLGMIIASLFIKSNSFNNIIVSTSSHTMASEKQYRNPTEYGAPKPNSATITSTGGASMLLTSKKSSVKVESVTIGKINDYNQKDSFNMGAVMACSAADTLYTHLKETNRDISYYDLILSGDLGLYGKNILVDYMKEKYDITLNNYNDCGVMLYDLKTQKNIYSGGSGPVCSALVINSYIYPKIKNKELKRVLYIGTGALFSATSYLQKNNILSIAHLISLEGI